MPHDARGGSATLTFEMELMSVRSMLKAGKGEDAEASARDTAQRLAQLKLDRGVELDDFKAAQQARAPPPSLWWNSNAEGTHPL